MKRGFGDIDDFVQQGTGIRNLKRTKFANEAKATYKHAGPAKPAKRKFADFDDEAEYDGKGSKRPRCRVQTGPTPARDSTSESSVDDDVTPPVEERQRRPYAYAEDPDTVVEDDDVTPPQSEERQRRPYTHSASPSPERGRSPEHETRPDAPPMRDSQRESRAPPARSPPPQDAHGLLRPSLTIPGLIEVAQTAQRQHFPLMSPERLAELEVQAFFLKGTGVAYKLWTHEAYAVRPTARDTQLMLAVTERDVSKVLALSKYLRLRERPKWHSDRLNRRTGVPGLVNAGNGSTELVILVRSAVQELIEQCEAVEAGSN